MPRNAEIGDALARRLPAVSPSERAGLAKAYFVGVETHALARTNGTGPVPTGLGTERAELMAHVSRAMERLLNEDEIAALLRITQSAARSVSRNMLAVYDDLPTLSLKAAFQGASRDGRGTAGDIVDGYRVKFSTQEKAEMAQAELERRGYLCESVDSSGSRHILLVGSNFQLDDVLAESPS